MDQKSNQGVHLCNYTLQKQIGQGSFGTVYRALDINGDVVAIKVIPEKILEQQDGQVAKLLEQEINTMYKIKNPNVVKILDYRFHKENHYIVMEYCDGGDLKQLLANEKGQLPEVKALSIFKQIINGIKGLHEKNIIHRDLKLENIFIHQNKYIKIGDLGFSKQLKHEDDQSNLCLGSPGTIAPEVLKNIPYGSKADIFSMGVLLYQMLYGRLPFDQIYDINKYLLQIKLNKLNFDGNPSVTQQVQELIKLMLKEDPNQRIGFVEIYKHPIFEKKDISQQSFHLGLNLTNLISDQLDVDQNIQFYTNQKLRDSGRIIPYNQNQADLSEGKGLVDWSAHLKQKYQQQIQNYGQNKYITPGSDQDQNIPLLQNQDGLLKEKQINELIQKYINRFNSIQYVINTLTLMVKIYFPNVYSVIYPQMILHKKAIVEFKKLYQSLLQKINIFNDPVFDKIILNENIIKLTEILDAQIKIQEVNFSIFYQPQVDENLNSIQIHLQKNWLQDNKLEPSEFFEQNYREALEFLLQIILKMKQVGQQSVPEQLNKLEAHIKLCLNFQQLLFEKVELSIEFLPL